MIERLNLDDEGNIIFSEIPEDQEKSGNVFRCFASNFCDVERNLQVHH